MSDTRPKNFREKRLHKLFDECQNSVLEQIIQPFGLSRAMFSDKDGGGVNTIHNVRNGVYATEAEKEKYENRGDYDSGKYHGDKRYIEKNKSIKDAKDSGTAVDAYTKQEIALNEKIDLDHTISAKEAHDDPGVYLADKKVEDLVNTQSNLNATNSSINRSKGAMPMKDFIKKWEAGKEKRQEKIRELSQKENLTDNERNTLKKLKDFEKFSPEAGGEKDKKARKDLNKKVNEYYQSDKFVVAALKDASNAAVRTAIQQALGKILLKFAQATFTELKVFIREIKSIKGNVFSDIRMRLKRVMEAVIEEVKNWKEIAQNLGSGFLAGFFSALVTTLVNVFATTAKRFVRAIREGIRSLFETFKLLFFRPADMTEEDALKIIIKSLSGVFITTCAIAAETSLNSFIQTVPVIGQFASIITPVLLGILSGISIALVSYTVDIAFDIFNKSSRDFDELLKLSDLQAIFSQKLTQTINSFIKMGREYSNIIKNYDGMANTYAHMSFQGECLLISSESMVHEGRGQYSMKQEILSSITEESESKTLILSEVEKTKQWLEKRNERKSQNDKS